MRREGITLPSEELGWFLRNRLGLDAIRVQLLDTALRGRESYEEVEAEALRLFRDLHSEDPLRRKSATDRSPLLSRFLSQSQSGASSYRTSLRWFIVVWYSVVQVIVGWWQFTEEF